MQKTRLILTALFLPFTALASEQFVSLTLLSAPSSVAELEEALAIEELAPAFKRSVNSQLRNLQQAA